MFVIGDVAFVHYNHPHTTLPNQSDATRYILFLRISYNPPSEFNPTPFRVCFLMMTINEGKGFVQQTYSIYVYIYMYVSLYIYIFTYLHLYI